MVRKIESLFVSGPAGRLEALLEEPEAGEPREAALVCHPHPLFGGTLHNKVVHRLARALRANGAAVLRFNFRGVNLSAGVHDNGIGEVEDARAALAELRGRYPSLPYTLAGFSFGSRMALRLGCALSESPPRRLIAAGYPTKYGDHDYLRACRLPRIFLHSTNDEHGPRAELQAVYDQIWEPKRLIWIESQDHFFAGALGEFEQAVRSLG